MTTAKVYAGTGTGPRLDSQIDRLGDGAESSSASWLQRAPVRPTAHTGPVRPAGRGTFVNRGTTSAPTELIGRKEIVPAREVFAHEATNFTTWPEGHFGVQAERLEAELTTVQQGNDVGAFNVDLPCDDGEGRPVITENQLERTDHDHLGKLLTYPVNLNAATAIWITTGPRPEHERVVDWLNESTPEDIAFFVVKIEGIRINYSPLAPVFTVLSAPSERAKEIGRKKKEWAARHHKRFEFWQTLLERSKRKTSLFESIFPSRDLWMSKGAGKSGVQFSYVYYKSQAFVDLYIDHDRKDDTRNKEISDAQYNQQHGIEKAVDLPVKWERLDDKRASRIRVAVVDKGLTDEDFYPDIQDRMIEAMMKFHGAVEGRLNME